jgi:membrane glycosyltransferase
VCAQAVSRPVTGWPREAIADALVERALRHGLDALTPSDRSRLLTDPAALSALHFAVWTSPAAHVSWREAIARPVARPAAPRLHTHDETEANESAAGLPASHPVHG